MKPQKAKKNPKQKRCVTYILEETGQTYQGCCIAFFFNLILDHVTDLEYLQWSPFLPAVGMY